MSDIAVVRSAFRTWADKQPEAVRVQANLVVKNLAHLAKDPDDQMLLAQTRINIARLEGAKRA